MQWEEEWVAEWEEEWEAMEAVWEVEWEAVWEFSKGEVSIPLKIVKSMSLEKTIIQTIVVPQNTARDKEGEVE